MQHEPRVAVTAIDALGQDIAGIGDCSRLEQGHIRRERAAGDEVVQVVQCALAVEKRVYAATGIVGKTIPTRDLA